MAATMSSCRVFGAGRLRAGGCMPSSSRNAGGSGGPSKNAPAPAGGVPSKERRDIPSQGSLCSAQVRAACPHRAPAAFCARPRRLAGRWLPSDASPRVSAVRAAALGESDLSLPQLLFRSAPLGSRRSSARQGEGRRRALGRRRA